MQTSKIKEKRAQVLQQTYYECITVCLLIYQLTNALNKIQFITGIKLLYVLALGCHPQELHNKGI
jgi:hypothetical protein